MDFACTKGSRFWSLLHLCIGAWLGGAIVLQVSARGADVTVDASVRYQTIDGFGSCLFGGFEVFERGYFDSVVPIGVTYKTDASQRAAILKAAIHDLGLSHARINIPPLGIEPENDNDDPQVMAWDRFDWAAQSGKPQSSRPIENRFNGIVEWGEFLKTAISLGLVNWIPTPAGMPEWLKHRLNDPSDQQRFEEYAEWAAAHLLYLKRNFGLEAPYWSMHNEPDNESWASPEFCIPWITATGARFEKEGLKTKIMFPDFMDANRAVPLTRAVLADERARKYIGALAYHHYRTSGDGPQAFLRLADNPERAQEDEHLQRVTRAPREMAELGRRYGIASSQTETAYLFPQTKNLSDWEIGRGRANEIYYELQSGASAVDGQFGIWVEGIDPRVQGTGRNEGHHLLMYGDGQRVTSWAPSKSCGVVFAHYGRYVRPGDWRINAQCDDPSVRVTAFATQKKAYVLVLLNNADRPKRIVVRLDRAAFSAKYAGAITTDVDRTLKPMTVQFDPVNAACSFELAAKV